MQIRDMFCFLLSVMPFQARRGQSIWDGMNNSGAALGSLVELSYERLRQQALITCLPPRNEVRHCVYDLGSPVYHLLGLMTLAASGQIPNRLNLPLTSPIPSRFAAGVIWMHVHFVHLRQEHQACAQLAEASPHDGPRFACATCCATTRDDKGMVIAVFAGSDVAALHVASLPVPTPCASGDCCSKAWGVEVHSFRLGFQGPGLKIEVSC